MANPIHDAYLKSAQSRTRRASSHTPLMRRVSFQSLGSPLSRAVRLSLNENVPHTRPDNLQRVIRSAVYRAPRRVSVLTWTNTFGGVIPAISLPSAHRIELNLGRMWDISP